MNKTKTRNYLLWVLGIFIIVFTVININFVHAAWEDRSSVNVTIPSEIDVLMKSTGENEITDFNVGNDSLVPITLNKINVTKTGGWDLVNSNSIKKDTKQLKFIVDGVTLQNGSNTINNTIAAESNKSLSTSIIRGAWTSNQTKEASFKISVEYDIGTANFTANFNSNGGSNVSNITAKNGETITLPTPTKDGYTFIGWMDGFGNTITDGTYTMPIGGMVFTAQWKIDKYTITYDGIDGANFSTENPETYKPTDSDITLVNPTKTGYNFIGWTGSNGSTPQITVTIASGSTGNKTYTANWTEITATLTYNANSGSGAPSAVTMKYTTATTVSSTVPTRTGYTFAGWNTAQNGSGTSYTAGDTINAANVVPTATTLYAQWVEKTATLTYNSNGGTGGPSTDTMRYTTVTTVLSTTPTKTGYNFAGWNTAQDGSGNSYSAGDTIKAANVVPSNTTLYAQWTEKTATLTYNANGGSGAPAAVTMKYTTATTVSSIVPTRTGYTFKNWNTKADGSGTSYTSGNTINAANAVPSATTLYAQWTLNTYTITYSNISGASFSTTNPSSYNVNSSNITLVNPTKTGYTFTGWTGSNGSTPQTTVIIANGSTGNKTYTANWSEKTATLTYNANGGSGAPSAVTMKYTTATTVSSTVPTRTGYTFKNWNTKQDGSGTSYTSGNTIKAANVVPSATTLYAQWKSFVLKTGEEVNSTIPDSATSLIFTDEVAPSDATLTDLSVDGSNSIVGWLDGTTYKISTQISGLKVFANPNSSTMFQNKKDLNNIDVKKLDVSLVTNMFKIFYYTGFNNTSTFTIDGLDNWNTSSVTDMSNMFTYAGYKATTWNIGDLSNWDTSSVTTMKSMFSCAGSNASIWNIGDLNNWDTSSVTTMYYMFNSAGNKATTWNIGDLSNWDTSSVTHMGYMFYTAGHNSSTWNIGYLSNWDTSLVTNMSNMFSYAGHNSSTWNIGDLSNWDTSSVTTMYYMFNNAGNKATTWNIGDLSNWDTSSVTNMSSMFMNSGKNSSTWNIGNLSNWDTSSVTNMGYLFYGIPVKELNLSNWDTSLVTNMNYMFDSCTKLNKITLGKNFAWVGTSCYLPTPKSTYITGADGKWYNTATGVGYVPSAIPSNTAATYVAVKGTK